MEIAKRLRELARNLYWTWHPELIEVFRDLDPQLWREVNHNPVMFLRRLPVDALEAKTSELSLDARISQAFHQMQWYLECTETWGSRYAGPLHARLVAYFSAEFGLHESLPLYGGGLGVLAGDHLKGASDVGVPVVGVGLFYAEGYFRQHLDGDGWQVEEYDTTDVDALPIDRATDDQGRPVQVQVQTPDSTIQVGVWTAEVGRNRLILLDTNLEGNDEADRHLSAHLYGGDRRVRIRQELVLGVGGLRAMTALGVRPGVLHLNEGHNAFAVLELARQFMECEGRSFQDIREKVASMTVFTTHTPVEAGHDRFAPPLVAETLGTLRDALGLSEDHLLALGRVNPDDQAEPFCMTVLGLKLSRWRHGVSSRHGRVARAMWKGLWPDLPEKRVPIGHITNGVHMDSWLAVSMAPLYERYLGPDWQKRLHDPAMWSAIDEMDDDALWEQHQILKIRLIDFVERRIGRTEGTDDGSAKTARLDANVLTIGFARRFAPYKRGDLLLHDPDRLARIVGGDDPVQILYAGKAHPDNEDGKRLIQKIVQLARQDRFAGRIVFLEDHDINIARHLVQGVDVWLNTPRRPLEACGTSGQKAVLNGGLNLSILDGWWAEAYDGTNGFAIGEGCEHADPARQDEWDTEALYDVLEREVLPLYYDRDHRGVPLGWVARQKNAIRSLPWRFSARRMVMDYTEHAYLPAIGGTTRTVP